MKTLFQFLLIAFSCISIYSLENKLAQQIEYPVVNVQDTVKEYSIELKSIVAYPQFAELTEEVQRYRQNRLILLDTFLKYSQEENTIILDTRSRAAYKGRHLSGAINLPFSDFTSKTLKEVIPNKETRILIYCNNNFSGDPAFMLGKLPPLALNIPTFINLYGYGYKNVFELFGLTNIKDPKIKDKFVVNPVNRKKTKFANLQD